MTKFEGQECFKFLENMWGDKINAKGYIDITIY